MFLIKGTNYETGSIYERTVKASSYNQAEFSAAELQIDLGKQWYFTVEEI